MGFLRDDYLDSLLVYANSWNHHSPSMEESATTRKCFKQAYLPYFLLYHHVKERNMKNNLIICFFI